MKIFFFLFVLGKNYLVIKIYFLITQYLIDFLSWGGIFIINLQNYLQIMEINSQQEFEKYQYFYENTTTINTLLTEINQYQSAQITEINQYQSAQNKHYFNTKFFSQSSYIALFNKYEISKFWPGYFAHAEEIKSEINKYDIDYEEIENIDIRFDFVLDFSKNSKFITEIILWEKIKINFHNIINIFNNINISDIDNDNEVHNCIFKWDIFLSKTIQKLYFIDCIIENELWFNKNNSWPYDSNKVIYSWELLFRNSVFNQLSFDRFNINKLTIEFTSDFVSESVLLNNISFKNSKITKLRLYSDWNENLPKLWELSFTNYKFEKDSENFISHLKINTLNLKSSTNLTDSFKITSVVVTEKFILEDVDFWKIIFNWLNLAESELNFKHVTFNNCIFNNVIWNKGCIIKNSNDEELRDLYRQMKFIMDKLWDTITGSKFYRNEMEIQKNIVSWDNKKSNLNIFFWWSKSERFVFWFWYNINNFWQNWIKPLIILFILNFILWSFSHAYIWIDWFQNINNIFSFEYWENFWFNFSSYVSYLTPFRKLSEDPWFFDILARIISTILIYQSAVALRRKIQR